MTDYDFTTMQYAPQSYEDSGKSYAAALTEKLAYPCSETEAYFKSMQEYVHYEYIKWLERHRRR